MPITTMVSILPSAGFRFTASTPLERGSSSPGTARPTEIGRAFIAAIVHHVEARGRDFPFSPCRKR